MKVPNAPQVEYVFSHVGYYIVKVPKNGGGETFFASTSAAYDKLTPVEQERWANLCSVNSNGGAVHPLV